jgi:glyoxylase-like metal-dependent hydrolase (beta-lactamase superfamily II)
MIKVERKVFNAFQENTYLVYDETGECLIIDPGCQEAYEEEELFDFIKSKGLKPVGHLYTHAHIDHILGNGYVNSTYGLKPVMHEASKPIFMSAGDHGRMFGIEINEIVEPEIFIDEGEIIRFGNSSVEVLYTPGHVDGHVCFVNHPEKWVIVGDVLFRDSIGRTDLPTGDFDLLSDSIRNKLYTLGADYTVFPGHGPETSIGHEMRNNPFVQP